MSEDNINQFDEQAAEKDTVNQFEQETGKSKVFNKRTLIVGTLIGISVPVAFFLSLDYFNKTTPATLSYQYVLAEHLKVNKLNNPKGKTRQVDKIEQANKTKQANRTKQPNKALTAATATINPKNSHKNSPKNTTKTTTLKAKINKTHQNNQAQIESLYNKTQTSLNTLLESQERHRETQERHRNEIALKVDQLQANTKKTISQFIEKMSALFNQQATKTVEPKPEPRARARSKANPLKQTNTAVFELVDISLWDDRPQATIRYQGKTSIVDIGSIRIGWKIINIDFDKEQITIANAKAKNGQHITLEKIR